MSALARSVKKHVHGPAQSVRVDPGPGWADALESELQHVLQHPLQAYKYNPEIQRRDGYLDVENLDFRQMLELPLRLLTAAEILWTLDSKHVGSFGEYDAFLRAINWKLYLPPGVPVRVRLKSFRSQLYHEGKLEKMAETVLRELGWQVTAQKSHTHIITILQEENRCKVFMNLTAEPLFHRNYKVDQSHPAPLQEHLAAAAIRWARKESDATPCPDLIYVPFAGSGTLLVESYLALQGRTLRNSFSIIESLPEFPAQTWTFLRNRLTEMAQEQDCNPPLRGVEWDDAGFAALERNRDHASQLLPKPWTCEVVKKDIFQDRPPESAKTFWIPLNPPYGLRLGDEESAAKLYERIGRWLKDAFQPDHERCGFILVPDSRSFHAFEKGVGSQAIRGIHSFMQGGMHIRCVSFRLAQ